MDFLEVLDQAVDLLRQRGRLTYRTIKLQFNLDDDYLDALKDELIEGQRLAVDENGRVLVWAGETERTSVSTTQPVHPTEPPSSSTDQKPPPISYTPQHLAEKILTSRGALEGERKQVTVMFADIKGSMALLEDLDPEDARHLIDPALQLMMDAVHRYEGFVAQTMGDGIMALFGAPIAHEDHAQRALYAALRMQAESTRYAETTRLEYGMPMQMRIGINTGEVVVRSIRKDDLHTDYVPVGHSTGLAARIEQLATPGSIVVSEHTHKLTEGYFQFRTLGEAQVKGVRKPIPIYEVSGVGPLRTRLQVAASQGLVRFVGRQPELEQMQQSLQAATDGRGQIVAVMGDAGVGKSRLLYEFKLRVPQDCLVLETFSVSHGKAYAYLPLIELLKQYFRFTVEDDERTRREKVGGKVLMLDRSLDGVLP